MKLARLAGVGILTLVILAPALLATGGSNASGLSPLLSDAPPGLVPLAFQAGAMTGIDPNVLLAIARVETDWGRARQGQPDDLVPTDIRAGIEELEVGSIEAAANLWLAIVHIHLMDLTEPPPEHLKAAV